MSNNSEKKIELKIKSKLEQKKKKKTPDDGFKKNKVVNEVLDKITICLLYTSPSPRDGLLSRMPSSA